MSMTWRAMSARLSTRATVLKDGGFQMRVDDVASNVCQALNLGSSKGADMHFDLDSSMDEGDFCDDMKVGRCRLNQG